MPTIQELVAADRASTHPRKRSLEDRFSANFERSPGCWLWTGFRNQDGYGRMLVGGGRHRRLILAHRIALFFDGRDVPPGYVTRHTCHTPACVRPDHLIVGTQAENVGDTVAAGRTARGEKSGHCILTEEQATEIKASQEDRGVLAERFGVARSTIDGLRQGTRWTHLPISYVPPAKGQGRRAFTPGEIKAIRSSSESSQVLADRYQVSAAAVMLARRGITYAKHNHSCPPQAFVSPTRRKNDGKWLTTSTPTVGASR